MRFRFTTRPLTAAEISEQYRTVAWQLATLATPASNLSTWSQVLPEVEGIYRINGRTTDGYGNLSEPFPLWEGMVDTVAPRATISFELIGDGATAQTEYSYTITDFNLDSSTIVAPCLDQNPTETVYASRWYRSNFGIVNPADGPITSITGLCQTDGHNSTPVTLSVCDLYGNCALVEPDGNYVPEAVDDAVTTDEDVAVTIDVLVNDSDANGDTLTIDSVTDPTNGSVVNQRHRYHLHAPIPASLAQTALTIQSAMATVAQTRPPLPWTVSAVNDVPVAVDDTEATDEDTAVTIDILANDSDAMATP